MAIDGEILIEPKHDATSLAVRAHQVTAITPASYADTIGLGRAIRSVIDGITADDAPEIAKAFQLHKSLIKKRDEKLAPLEIAYAYLKEMIGKYDQEQERIRRQKELEAQETLRKQQEEDALREAEALQASGDSEGAQMVIQQQIAAPSPTVIVPSALPKVTGKSSREVWTFQIENESLIPREYMTPDHSKIGAVVRALKANSKIPGIKAYSTTSVSLR